MSLTVLKLNGTQEEFDPRKLVISLTRAGATDEVVSTIIGNIEDTFSGEVTTSAIYEKAFELLKQLSKKSAVKYSLKKALMELGPDGFPFERLVSEIFKGKGYQAITGQVVQGACVEHEVDVVAWKDEELIMVEAKYHNELGYKSDLKTALYIKARFDDLKANNVLGFEYGSKKRVMTEGMLITNTKFTDHAIRYGECQNLKMVGWNYPNVKGENLQDLIHDAKIHPLTCLDTLSSVDKQKLLQAKLILCRDIIEEKDNLVGYGIDKEKIPHILAEINEVTN